MRAELKSRIVVLCAVATVLLSSCVQPAKIESRIAGAKQDDSLLLDSGYFSTFGHTVTIALSLESSLGYLSDSYERHYDLIVTCNDAMLKDCSALIHRPLNYCDTAQTRGLSIDYDGTNKIVMKGTIRFPGDNPVPRVFGNPIETLSFSKVKVWRVQAIDERDLYAQRFCSVYFDTITADSLRWIDVYDRSYLDGIFKRIVDNPRLRQGQ